jgi:tetratricopeptide (TPR) repeat protein
VLEHRGAAALQSGDYRQAAPFYQESFEIRRAIGDRRGLADSLDQQSFALLFQGQLEEGKQLAIEHNAIRQEIGERIGLIKGLINLQSAQFWLGEFVELGARPLTKTVPPILNDLGDRAGVADCTIYQSWTELHLGQYERAQVSARRGLTLSQELGDRLDIGFSSWALGCIALANNAYAAAEQWLQESTSIFRDIGKRDGLNYALAVLACAACALGQPAQARQYLREALRITADIQVFSSFMFPLPATALLLANLGQVERAVELYALASRYPFVANSRWFEDAVGRHIAAAAQGLVPEVTRAAQERGRARDLAKTVEKLLAELDA